MVFNSGEPQTASTFNRSFEGERVLHCSSFPRPKRPWQRVWFYMPIRNLREGSDFLDVIRVIYTAIEVLEKIQ